MSESLTHQTLIDGHMKAAGWDVHDRLRVTTGLKQRITIALNAVENMNETYSFSMTALEQHYGSLRQRGFSVVLYLPTLGVDAIVGAEGISMHINDSCT